MLNVRQNIKYKETMTIVNNRTDEPIPQKQQENTKNIWSQKVNQGVTDQRQKQKAIEHKGT